MNEHALADRQLLVAEATRARITGATLSLSQAVRDTSPGTIPLRTARRPSLALRVTSKGLCQQCVSSVSAVCQQWRGY
jgi:hypothetical protein